MCPSRCLSLLLLICLVDPVSLGAAFDHSHRAWDGVLKAHVEEDLVDYAGLAAGPDRLDGYLDQLDSVSRREVDSWTREQQLAFWINAYNAFTVRAILDHYPIHSWTLKGIVFPRNSILQIPGVWKKQTWAVAGQSLTLDHIEHGLIRPRFGEPRIHFAIVCASIGCPDLRTEAYIPEKLEAQLEDQTRRYLFDEEKGVKLDFAKKEVGVSQLFKWFWEDFSGEPPPGFDLQGRSDKERAALQYISRYRNDPRDWELLQSESTRFDYLRYDWSLNDLKEAR